MTTTITIKHTFKDGTLVYGTEKGDGVYELIGQRTPARFRFFPSIKMIGIPQSRDRLAKRYQIECARTALVAAGYEVVVEIDDTPRDMDDVKTDRTERLDRRFERLTASAERHLAEGTARRERADELDATRPPIRAGHSSQGTARAHQKRLDQADQTATRELALAASASRAASVVGNEERYRERPSVIRRRIDRLESELRVTEHKINGTRPATQAWMDAYYPVKPAEGDDLAAFEARKAFLEHQIAAERDTLARYEADGYVILTRADLHKGDVVTWSDRPGSSATVTRVNPKTVTLDRTRWPAKLGYEQIRSVECPHQDTTVTVRAPRQPDTRPKAAPITIGPAPERAAPLVVDKSFEFYPTPPAIAARVIKAAKLVPDMMVLEPSAGLGGIAIPAAQEGCLVTCFELSQDLATRLRGACAADDSMHVNCANFLEVQPNPLLVFDRVLMNPPFHGQADIAHVVHALRFLKPGGLLVAIMSAGVEFHQNKTATGFRKLVEDCGGRIEPLPDDAFKGTGASVRTVMVVIPVAPVSVPAPVPSPRPAEQMALFS